MRCFVNSPAVITAVIQATLLELIFFLFFSSDEFCVQVYPRSERIYCNYDQCTYDKRQRQQYYLLTLDEILLILR